VKAALSGPERAARALGGALGRVQAAWLAQPGNRRGALWMIAAAFGFTVNSALVKALAAGGLPAFQIALARAGFSLAALLPLIWLAGPGIFRTRHPWIHAGRGFAGGIAMLCGFYALTKLPLAEVTALSFTTPLFTIVLAVLLLREPVRWRRWSATLVGFLGVLIMVRPGAAAFDPAAFFALAMALGIAVAVILLKRFPEGESHVAMLTWFSLAAIALSLGPALYVWRPPTPGQWSLLVAVGLLGLGAQAMFIRAFWVGEASFVAPFDYSKLLLAGLIGFLLFGERPDLWSLVGAAVIVAATVYIARREGQLGGAGADSARADSAREGQG